MQPALPSGALGRASQASVLTAGDPIHWTGREQTWNYQCAECHSTDFRKNYDAERNGYASAWAEVTGVV